MKISKISLNNFRQYYGTNTIDLSTSTERNIVLIGGKNGYGKTNFLMSLVWCLYGEDISKIDENFKKEIQKEGNYSRFLRSSLNWDAERSGNYLLSVQIELDNIELPETLELSPGVAYKCLLTRSFDTTTSMETFEVSVEGVNKPLFTDNDAKKEFVNDYLIPIEAAKFVFFDAEKIASWAELSTRDEGSVLNDALGKILGLDLYEILINDLETYTDGLRKESATSVVSQQITTTEKGIELNIEKSMQIENDIISRESVISEFKSKIAHYEVFLIKHGTSTLNIGNLEDLYNKKRKLTEKERESEEKFSLLSELIPFAIAAGNLEEVIEHLQLQDQSNILIDHREELIDKNNLLLERLFNTPPFPTDGDISFAKKMFYADKAKVIIEEIFGNNDALINEVEFEHDLNKSEGDLIFDTFNYIKKQSKETLEQTIDSFNLLKNEMFEVDRLIRQIELDQQDEEVIRYTNNKTDAERKVERIIEEKGAFQNQLSQLKKDIETDNQRLQLLIKKIEVSQQKKKKLDKANQYISTLKAFVEEQKRSKCEILETEIYKEMQKLMHKLQDSTNTTFVAGVKAEPLPDNDGLKITLLDNNGQTRHKESLSQGEKQIYISSLIKAILSLSIQDFPIFIDTPLGRLDDEHIKNILLNYYPDLAAQVVLMATNNEIPPSRFRMMEANVAQTYLLENHNNRTTFKKGYFQSYEN